MLNKDSKIYVAGHHGLVGSAIWNNLLQRGYTNLIGRSHKELDLTDQVAVKKFFDEERPDAVVLAAAFVGGIMANSLYRADFIMMNMKIQCNVISEAYAHGVKKLLFLGSTCIYPKNAPQPMKEDCLLTSPLEYTNEEYAIAKIAGLKMCESYNLQYGTNYIAVMPTNLYGPNDNFHLENSHVMPAMMRKIYLAKLIHDGEWDKIAIDLDKRPVEGVSGSASQDEILNILAKYGIYNNKVVLWGTGTPLREFLWSEDMADASVHVLLNVNFSDIIGIENATTQQDAVAPSPNWARFATATSTLEQVRSSPFANSQSLLSRPSVSKALWSLMPLNQMAPCVSSSMYLNFTLSVGPIRLRLKKAYRNCLNGIKTVCLSNQIKSPPIGGPIYLILD